MIVCGYCGECCGYWRAICGYWKNPLPATIFAGQTVCRTPLRVVAGINRNSYTYTRAHTRTYIGAGNGITTRQYPHYPQRACDLRFCLRVVGRGAGSKPRTQYPQTPRAWIARPRPQWEAVGNPSSTGALS